MNYEQEQKDELEALSEIYYKEIKVRSREVPISFSVKVSAFASSFEGPENITSDGEDESLDDDYDDDDDHDDDDEDNSDESLNEGNNHSGQYVELLFTLPPKYPDEKPSIQILSSKNLEVSDLSEMVINLDQKCEESLGSVMIFTLVTDVIEWLSIKSDKEAYDIEQVKESQQKERESIEKKKIDGTLVTVQSFLAWKAKFDAELLSSKLQQTTQSTRGPTGRAMFESDETLAESDLNFVEDLDQNQIEALLHNIEEVDLGDD